MLEVVTHVWLWHLSLHLVTILQVIHYLFLGFKKFKFKVSLIYNELYSFSTNCTEQKSWILQLFDELDVLHLNRNI